MVNATHRDPPFHRFVSFLSQDCSRFTAGTFNYLRNGTGLRIEKLSWTLQEFKTLTERSLCFAKGLTDKPPPPTFKFGRFLANAM